VDLRNQVALVVGASSGIGRETAILLARDGVRVMASARREDRLRELRAAMQGEGLALEYHVADASDPEAMETLARVTRAQLGEIDIMVYSTGTNIPDRALERLQRETWDRMISVNLSGAYYITRAVLPAMRERGRGHLIYISSISGQTPDVSGAAYQAAKRGLIGLAHAIRVEEKGRGIRTCAILPGLVDTEILNNRPVKPAPETLAKALRPEDVAEAVLAVARLPERVVVPELQILPTML
jgi:NADP-dependent 3-hydroxy acid dehydrogenase YdfG